MPNGQTLELADLPAMHPPIGVGLLLTFGPSVVFRLSIDPTPQPSGTINRAVQTDWVGRPGNGQAVLEHRNIGWANLRQAIPKLSSLLDQLPSTMNADDLTEKAAIGVMALLIHDLESAVLQTVLEIGSGGDYLVQVQEGKAVVQVEVRGIRRAQSAAVSKAKLAEKRKQVLKHSKTGYASVTTFAYPGGPMVHSYLHYVRQASKKKARAKRKKP